MLGQCRRQTPPVEEGGGGYASVKIYRYMKRKIDMDRVSPLLLWPSETIDAWSRPSSNPTCQGGGGKVCVCYYRYIEIYGEKDRYG